MYAEEENEEEEEVDDDGVEEHLIASSLGIFMAAAMRCVRAIFYKLEAFLKMTQFSWTLVAHTHTDTFMFTPDGPMGSINYFEAGMSKCATDSNSIFFLIFPTRSHTPHVHLWFSYFCFCFVRKMMKLSWHTNPNSKNVFPKPQNCINLNSVRIVRKTTTTMMLPNKFISAYITSHVLYIRWAHQFGHLSKSLVGLARVERNG